MKKILFNALFVSAIAMGIAWALVGVFGHSVLGLNFSSDTLFMAFLVPLMVAFPTTLILELQKRKLDKENHDLKMAHHRLSLAHSAVQHKSERDGLTGLFNRDHFFEIASKLHKRGVGGTLLMIDADKFKVVNDTYGHVAGDHALRLISEAIADSVRPDDFVGRVGGEEFAVFARDVALEEASIVAERIRSNVEATQFKPTMMDTHKLTVSIGGASFRADCDITKIMQRADERLYAAKNSGRNRCVLDPAVVSPLKTAA